MILGKEHLRTAAKGGCCNVVLPGQRDEVLESFRILQDWLAAIVCYSNVDIEMCDTVLYTKLNKLLPRFLC